MVQYILNITADTIIINNYIDIEESDTVQITKIVPPAATGTKRKSFLRCPEPCENKKIKIFSSAKVQ